MNCSSLTSFSTLKIATLTEVGSNAFNGCSSLTYFYCSQTVEKIGNFAFKDCVSLTQLAYGKHCPSYPADAFEGCNPKLQIG
ncbi:MAG: leucine-rich repeat protein [Bacilli bacterium]|nr:leucine-rich repeat protein [Bacilli bacterium]